MNTIFSYGEKEISYLKQQDKALGQAMDTIGHVSRKVEPDLFFSLVCQIIGQQISMTAQNTICQRLKDCLGSISPRTIHDMPMESLRQMGVSPKKGQAIKTVAANILAGALQVHELNQMDDQEVIQCLSSFRGIGVWTAEMTLIFSMQRPDVLSFGDLGIHKGLRMLYHHPRITPALFARYKKRYSPFASVASLYLWEIAGGRIPGMRDYAPENPSKKYLS